MRSLSLCLVLLPWPALAGTLTVGDGADYATLAAALEAAETGDTIRLGEGDFDGGVVVGKSVVIEGSGSTSTVLTSSVAVISLRSDVQLTVRDLAIEADGDRAIEAAVGSLTLVDLRISGGRHDVRGAGVFFTGDALSITGSTFEDNRAIDGLGGHLYVRTADAVIVDSIFDGGLARRGGAIYSSVGTLDITGSVFTKNGVRGDRYEDEEGKHLDEGMGGAIASETASLTVSESTFDGNGTEDGRGGQINTLGGEVVLIDVDLLNGSATERYGAGMATFNTKVSITGGRFVANRITTKGIEDDDAANGAGLFLHGSLTAEATITGTVFRENSAALHGGAIRVAGGKATITDAVFESNEGYFGGAIHVATPYGVLVQGSRFSENRARFGAAIRWRPPTNSMDSSALELVGNTYVDNTAEDYGGVLYGRAGGTLKVRDNRMERNTAGLGGAMMLWGLREVDVVGNTLCLNVASDSDVPDGGGIASYLNGEGGHVRLANNVFVENRATAFGGGVSLVEDVNVVIENNHFLANRGSEGGGVGVRSSGVLLRNNLFAWAPGGAGLAVRDLAGVRIEHNAFYENLDTQVGDDIELTGSNLVDLDPKINTYSPNGDCGDDDYHLLANSPLIDAGDPTVLDPDETTSDIGAFGGPDADPDLYVDLDEDGYAAASDCDDDNKDVNPGAQEIPYDGVDQDCSGDDLVDVDGDGYDGGDEGPDCDDDNKDVNPGADEIWYDGVDGDCDGSDDYDQDGDGVAGDGGPDCNDQDTSVFPGAVEIDDDSKDSDCDGNDNVGGCGGCASTSGGPVVLWGGLLVLGLVRRRR
ncbi:MAG: hypothetical protein ACI9MC_001302 [Kiritimatiellia bacterium]|jgi:uncharacterized protein (TIGR03382 family)